MHTRDSIKRMDLGGGRTMMAFRVFPPYLEAFEKTELGKTAIGRDVVSDYERMAALIKALENASTADIELARPVLYFHLQELEEFIQSSGFYAMHYHLKLENGATAMLRDILDGVTKNVAENMAAVDHAPRSRGHQTVLRGCVAYLAEILALANVGVAAFGSDFESIVEDASASYVKFGRDIKKMSAELEARYAGISERVGDPDILLREADAHVMEVDMTVPDITAPVYERLLDSVGEINSMWRAYSSDKHMKEAVKAGRHRPMNDTNADELRTGLVHMFKEVNRSFNSGGLVSELLMATAAMRYRAGVSISQADAHSEADIRNDRKGLYESRDEYAARVAKGIADVPQERFRTRSDGASTMAKANLIGGFLSDVQASLHPDLERASMVSFRRFAEGILVGRISGLDDAIVISRDKEVGERDAVWVARIPHAAIVGGFDNSKAKEFDGTNFYSVDDALQEIGTDRFQEMFFDGHKIDGHDGFDLLAEERRVIRKSIANGRDISSFPEYDGTSARTRAL